MEGKSILCTIVSYNPDYTIKKCVKAIYNQVDEILIVDNGSTKNLDLIKQFYKDDKVNIIFNNKNLGIACALNEGIKYALKNEYKWILTMDQDSEATINMVNNMLFSYNKLIQEDRNKIVSIFPTYLEKAFLKGKVDIEKSVNKEENKLNEENVHYVISEITSGNLVKCDIFNKIGYFEDKLFIDYVDHEFCLRIGKNGYKLIQVNNAYLLHSLGNSKKKNFLFKKVIVTNHSYLRRYYITRNKIYVWRNYYRNFPKFVFKDITITFKEVIKLILFEDDKKLKLEMIYKGIHDYINKIYGKLNM